MRLSKKQEMAQKVLMNHAIKEKLADKFNPIMKLIEENDEFVLSLCEIQENEQDYEDLADTLLRYVMKKKVQIQIYKK